MSIIQGHYDFSFYSEIARGLMKEGIESTDVRFTPLYHPSGTILYHYFDLWLTALLSILSNISTFRILMVVVYPFFYFLTLLGISSFIEKYSENILSLILLPFLLTFTLTLNIPLLKELDLFNYSNFGIHLSKYLQLKLLYIYPFILWAVHSFISKKTLKATLFLLLACTMYNTLLVPIIPATLLLGVFLFFTTSGTYINRSKNLILVSCYIVTVPIYMYYLSNKSDSAFEQVFFLSNIKSAIVVFFENIIKSGVFYLPVVTVLIIALVKSKFQFISQHKEIIIILITSLLGGLVFASLYHGTPNYNQAYYNFLPSATLVFFLISIPYLMNKYIYSIGALLFAINFFAPISIDEGCKTDYTQKYVQTCLNEFKKMESPKFLVYNPQEIQRWDYTFMDIAQFTSNIKNIPSGYNISKDFMDLVIKHDLSPFGKWCIDNEKKINEYSLIDYMSEKNIDYLFYNTDNQLPFNSDHLFVRVATDPLSRETLLRIIDKKNN
ncbi:MAG: hypothetical protein HRT72_08600 [Flavobacteriales bacterium]|nr:hypothetical protein [Flavobacteriales bacterium]